MISVWSAEPFAANTYTISLTVPTTAVPSDTILFGLDNGGYLTGTVVQVSTDGLIVSVTFPAGTDLGICDHFTTVYCENLLVCSSAVVSYAPNASDNTRIDLVLSSPIRAASVGQGVTVTYGNGDQVSATIVTANPATNQWTVDLGSTVFTDQVGGVLSICVPTSTDASCPGCGTGLTYTACTED